MMRASQACRTSRRCFDSPAIYETAFCSRLPVCKVRGRSPIRSSASSSTVRSASYRGVCPSNRSTTYRNESKIIHYDVSNAPVKFSGCYFSDTLLPYFIYAILLPSRIFARAGGGVGSFCISAVQFNNGHLPLSYQTAAIQI